MQIQKRLCERRGVQKGRLPAIREIEAKKKHKENDMSRTKIEWSEYSWNPIVGCTKCSPGCLNCYAERMAIRLNGIFAAKGDDDNWAKMSNVLKWDYSKPELYEFGKATGWNGEVELFANRLDIPLHWRKPRRIFVVSMGDLFHPKVNIGFLTHIFDTIEQCPQHTFLILTKRPKQALRMMWGKHGEGWRYFGEGDFHKNIHIGVSISNQAEADEKIPALLQIPAAVRFLSIEPMLEDVGEILLTSNREDDTGLDEFGQHIDWIVCGGESGPGARPMHPDWPRKVRDDCQAAGVPFFFKQWGEWLPGSHAQNFSDEQLSHYKTTLLEHKGNGVAMFRVGKKKAGRILDGKKWEQLPEKEVMPNDLS